MGICLQPVPRQAASWEKKESFLSEAEAHCSVGLVSHGLQGSRLSDLSER